MRQLIFFIIDGKDSHGDITDQANGYASNQGMSNIMRVMLS